MDHPDYNSPTELKSFLEANGMAMQKKFGQNFMISPDARKKIVGAMQLEEGMHVWEIGPGLGSITELMLEEKAFVTTFEIDRGFISFLHQFFSDYEQSNHFTLVEGDVLKTWNQTYKNQAAQYKVSRLTGNLPYNIAATFIAETITSNVIFDKCVFTVQKEVADRMAARPSTDAYSAFSVLCQWAYDVHTILMLPPGNFWPRPNVASAAVVFEKRSEPYHCSDPSFFVKVVHALFSSRRKTIHNNLRMIIPPELDDTALCEQAHLSPSARAEDLTIKQLIELSETVSSAILELAQK